jgi:hypothetical protein
MPFEHPIVADLDGYLVDLKTPVESPYYFNPDWRHRVAMYMHSQSATGGPLRPWPAYPDEYIRHQLEALKVSSSASQVLYNTYRTALRHGASLSGMPVIAAQANEIFMQEDNGGLRTKLETLLLCPDLTIEEVAGNMSMDKFIVEYYNKVFYNIRNDEGQVREGRWISEFFITSGTTAHIPAHSLQDDPASYFKHLAFSGHSAMVFLEWNWPMPKLPEVEMTQQIFRNTYNQVQQRTLSGNMSSKEMVALWGGLQDAMAGFRDQGLIEGNDALGQSEMLEIILEAMAPRPVTPSTEKMESKDAELKAKLEAVRQHSTDNRTSATLDSITAHRDSLNHSQ